MLISVADDMDIQLLLIVQKVCQKKNIKLPWDVIGKELGETITGGAIIQHLSKLRIRRIREDLPVPSRALRGKGGASMTPTVSSGQSASKGRTAKRTLESTAAQSDKGEDFDVDRASDSDASFGASRKKVNKRRSKAEIEKRRAKADDMTHRQGLKLKSRITKSTSKTRKPKMGRGKPPIKATQNGSDVDTDLDEDGGETYVGVGASFLRLVKPGDDDFEFPNGQRTLQEDAFGGDSGMDGDDDESEQGVRSITPATEGIRKLVVLRLGTSEYVRDFLGRLGRDDDEDDSETEVLSTRSANVEMRDSDGLGLLARNENIPRQAYQAQFYDQVRDASGIQTDIPMEDFRYMTHDARYSGWNPYSAINQSFGPRVIPPSQRGFIHRHPESSSARGFVDPSTGMQVNNYGFEMAQPYNGELTATEHSFHPSIGSIASDNRHVLDTGVGLSSMSALAQAALENSEPMFRAPVARMLQYPRNFAPSMETENEPAPVAGTIRYPRDIVPTIENELPYADEMLDVSDEDFLIN
jgi:hypothetical protein